MRTPFALAAALAVASCGSKPPPSKPVKPERPTPKGPDVAALRPQVDALVQPVLDGGWVPGLVVALVSDRGVEIAGYGRANDEGAAPDGRTVFEIGSVTKVFTAVLLAEASQRNVVALDALLQYLLPEKVKAPSWQGRPITLEQLAAHTSGLPRMPTNIARTNPANPYADYTVDQLYEFLSAYELPREPGSAYEYSNIGYGLLGHVLALRQKQSFEDLVAVWIGKPLGMDDTHITLSDDQKARLAQGHDGDGNAVPLWDIPALAGAGGLRSTAGDLVKFVQANLGLKKTALAPALTASHKPRAPTAVPKGQMALGWQIREDGHTLWQSGATGGCRAFIAFDEEVKVGVVVLANGSSGVVDDLGFAILATLVGEPVQPLSLPTTVAVEPAVLEGYVGKYKLVSAEAVLTVSGGAAGLTLEVGGIKAHLYPRSNTHFYVRIVDAELEFTLDKKGKPSGLVLRQEGSEQRASRMK